jgi:YidC/Oxa1 family membrane protein insertase
MLANPFSSLMNFIGDILGCVINWIFEGLDFIGIPNIGLSIILFTILVYALLLPSTMKQQKFSKLSQKMNPEIQAIQKKYKGKQDQVSMMKMNEETKAVYEKYGTSPTGGCLQLLITFPIFIALYRVIYRVPQYIDSIGRVYSDLADKISGNEDIIASIGNNVKDTKNGIMNALYIMDTSKFKELGNTYPQLKELVAEVADKMSRYNNFLGINLANSPMSLVKAGVYGAILIPILAGAFQWIVTKQMPTAQASPAAEENPMAASMKSMNMIMPIFSIVICFTMPSSMGLYWVVGGAFRCVQQFFINKHLEKVDIDELIQKNLDKVNKKRAKQGLPPKTLTAAAKTSTKNVESSREVSKEERQEEIKKSTSYYNHASGNSGSLRAKANMVRQYNERNKKDN